MSGKGGARWWRALLFVILLGLVGATAWLWERRDLPPIADLYQTRLYLNQVQQSASEDEALPLVKSAQENVDRAQAEMTSQFGRVVLFRNYDLTRYFISRAQSLCGDALNTSRLARQNAVADCQKRILALRRALSNTRQLLDRTTIGGGVLTLLTEAGSCLDAADSRLVDHQTREVKQLLDSAEDQIGEATVELQSELTRFLERRSQWDGWIQQTLAWSEEANQAALLIDKLNHTCYVLRRGRVVDSFAVELGGRWMAQKLVEGDRATPEGRYEVTQVKGSRFYKAAVISYPNESDRYRFVKLKRTGHVPRSARIGGLIEIHGEGGRGLDWTAGCVSLANGDLDRLLRYVRAGTPVTIVGLWQEPDWLNRLGARDEAGAPARSD